MLATTCHALRKRLPFGPTNSSAGTPPLEGPGSARCSRSTRPCCCGRRNLQCKSEHLRWDRPDLNCEPQQARGTPRNLQVDETYGTWVRGAGERRKGWQAHGEWWWQAEEKTGEGRMWLWWWAGALVAFFGAGMAGNTSKVEARRRAREALGRISVAETAIMVQLFLSGTTSSVARRSSAALVRWSSEPRIQVALLPSRRRANYVEIPLISSQIWCRGNRYIE